MKHYRFLTPSFSALQCQNQLPVSDASEKEDRIQKTEFRIWLRTRRQEQVVRRTDFSPKMQASESGSSETRPNYL